MWRHLANKNAKNLMAIISDCNHFWLPPVSFGRISFRQLINSNYLVHSDVFSDNIVISSTRDYDLISSDDLTKLVFMTDLSSRVVVTCCHHLIFSRSPCFTLKTPTCSQLLVMTIFTVPLHVVFTSKKIFSRNISKPHILSTLSAPNSI